jgi:hypothetical protein
MTTSAMVHGYRYKGPERTARAGSRAPNQVTRIVFHIASPPERVRHHEDMPEC